MRNDRMEKDISVREQEQDQKWHFTERNQNIHYKIIEDKLI